jgi:hypothetical protein
VRTIGIGKDFFSRTQVAQQLREMMDRWDYLKLIKKLQHDKRNVSKLKRPPMEWEKILC